MTSTDKSAAEREAFEAHMLKMNACTRLHRQREQLGGHYRTTTVQRAWELWQAARASLTTPSKEPAGAVADALRAMLAAHGAANDGREGLSVRVTRDQVEACRQARKALAAPGAAIDAREQEATDAGPSSKESWWSGARAGLGLPADTPRAVVAQRLAAARSEAPAVSAALASSPSSAPAESGWQWVPKRTVAEAAAFRWLIENRISEDENGWMRLTFNTPRQGKDHPRAAYWVARDIAYDAGVDLDEPDAPQAVQAGGEGGAA